MTSVSTGDQLRVAQPFAAVLVLVRQTVNESGEVWSLGPLSPQAASQAAGHCSLAPRAQCGR